DVALEEFALPGEPHRDRRGDGQAQGEHGEHPARRAQEAFESCASAHRPALQRAEAAHSSPAPRSSAAAATAANQGAISLPPLAPPTVTGRLNGSSKRTAASVPQLTASTSIQANRPWSAA